MKNIDLTIIIPCYNEQDSLPHLLPGLMEFCKERNWKILIVNDGSRDRSKEILESFGDGSILKVIHHKVNRGYGGALKTAVMNADTRYVITIDADGQHWLEDVERLAEKLMETDADMVIGSRKGQKNASHLRSLGKWLIRSVARTLMPVPIYDINSGMKLYNTEIARRYIHLYPDTMAYSDIIALVFINNRHLVIEEPIRIKQRSGGKSTIGIHTAFQTLLEILNIIVLFNPMRIFLPVSLLFFIPGLAWGAYIFSLGKGISIGSSLLLITSVIIFMLGLVVEQLSSIRKKM